ncbi:MAG: DUF1003 domain-containing protein [Ilumatobacteraceae bacterium]
MVKRREDLTAPRARRRRVRYDSDAIGRFSETIARFFGTGRFLTIQTVIVIVWIIINVTVVALRWDPYPFILLNLAFSTQAAYAAPLILLAQNRQEARDRVQTELDRTVAERTRSETEFLAREIAGVRLMLSDVVTGEELRDQLDELRRTLDRLADRLEDQAASGDGDSSAVGVG